MALFKKDKDGKDSQKGSITKSGRWIAPKDQQEQSEAIPGQPQPDAPAPAQPQAAQPQPAQEADPNVTETISQIDLDIPGMVVLASKEDRHLGRLNQDIKAKEEYQEQTGAFQAQQAPAAGSAPAGGAASDHGGIKLLEMLQVRERLTSEQVLEVQEVAGQTGITIIEALIQSGMMNEHEIGAFIAAEFKAPFSKLEVLRVHPNTVGILPPTDILQYKIIPLSKIGKTLNVAVVNPIDNPVFERLKLESGFDVKCIVCSIRTLNNTYQQFYG